MTKDNRKEIRKRFLGEIKSAFSLIVLSNKVEFKILPRYKSMIAELCFLKIYLAWEKLLGDSFTNFMIIDNNRYSFVRPLSNKHAEEIINEGKSYSDWDYEKAIKKSNRFFKKNFPVPRVISLISSELEDMKTIRNRIAHNSKLSEKNFIELVRKKRGYLPAKICPGDFLLSYDKNTGRTYFETYSNLLNIACLKITK